MLAKNQEGYKQLAKLSSIAFSEGFYYVPRIDKNLILEHKGDYMVTTGGLTGEVPHLILNVGDRQAEEAFCWWHEQFGDDFYIQLNRHGLKEEEVVNAKLLELAQKYGVKYFASSEVFYLAPEDHDAHDILLCVKDGMPQSAPKGRGRGFRFGMPNEDFYFKSKDEMAQLYADHPEALETTGEMIDKVEAFQLKRDVLLPKFDIPEEFQDPEDEKDGGIRGENAYLRHLAYEGAK
jgi:DNA polymerase-3 subunit alpha